MKVNEFKIGDKIGRLLIKETYNHPGLRYRMIICDCDCGIKDVHKMVHTITSNYSNAVCDGNTCPLRNRQSEIKVGNKYGKLLIKEIWYDENKNMMIRSDCDCGVKNHISPINVTRFKNSLVGCGCTVGRSQPGTFYSKYFASSYYKNVKRTSIKRGMVFNLCIEDLDILYERQAGLCFYTKEKLILPDLTQGNSTKNRLSYNVSIDRLDSFNKEYNLDNCVLCTKMCNLVKNVYSPIEFYNMCKSVVENKELQKYLKSKNN